MFLLNSISLYVTSILPSKIIERLFEWNILKWKLQLSTDYQQNFTNKVVTTVEPLILCFDSDPMMSEEW